MELYQLKAAMDLAQIRHNAANTDETKAALDKATADYEAVCPAAPKNANKKGGKSGAGKPDAVAADTTTTGDATYPNTDLGDSGSESSLNDEKKSE